MISCYKYPQNGDRIVTIDIVTSLHSMYCCKRLNANHPHSILCANVFILPRLENTEACRRNERLVGTVRLETSIRH